MNPLYIFDFDGTLTLIEHRRHLVERCASCDDKGVTGSGTACFVCGGVALRPDWTAFFAACVRDEPSWPAICTMRALLKSDADIWIWSGRSAVVMNETLAQQHRWVCGDEIDSDELQLMMRPEGDHTPDEAEGQLAGRAEGVVRIISKT